MKKLFDQHKWLKIVLGIVIFSLGLVTLIISLNNEGDVLLKIICIIVAIYCFSTALFGILAALITEKRNKYHGISGYLLTCGALVGVGIAFCFVDKASMVIGTIVGFFLPWILIASAAAVFVKFMILITNKDSRRDAPSWVRALVMWVLLLTIGIVFAVKGSEMQKYIYSTIGILVMVVGILVVVAGIISLVRENREKKLKVIVKK